VLQNSAVKNCIPLVLKKLEKIVENWKKWAEMQLTCEMNRKILKIRNSVELTELLAEFADNSAKFC
jgi:hypothetical protein